MISSYHFGMSWTPIHPPRWGRVERDRAEWKSFQKSEIRRLNPTFLKTFKCCIPYSVPAIFGFWRCENTEYLFRKYVEYLPNFRANFQKQFSGESAVDADWRGKGAVNCGWKTGGKLEVRSLTPQIHHMVQKNMEINDYFTLFRQWTRLSKWNWVWNCWCSCFWHHACLCGSTVSSLNNWRAMCELLLLPLCIVECLIDEYRWKHYFHQTETTYAECWSISLSQWPL